MKGAWLCVATLAWGLPWERLKVTAWPIVASALFASLVQLHERGTHCVSLMTNLRSIATSPLDSNFTRLESCGDGGLFALGLTAAVVRPDGIGFEISTCSKLASGLPHRPKYCTVSGVSAPFVLSSGSQLFQQSTRR